MINTLEKRLGKELDKLTNMSDEEYKVFLEKLETALRKPIIVVNQNNF